MSGGRNGRRWTPKFGDTPELDVTIVTFLRGLGLCYAFAFVSAGRQVAGLIGSQGILPFASYFSAAHEALGDSALWKLPSVLWLSRSDGALQAVWMIGAIAAAAAVLGFRQRIALAVCFVMWLSLCTAGQDFFGFQWDGLLCEAGFLAIFIDGSEISILLYRWLLFRLMFSSGVVKLLSHDPTWRNFTALTYHYETQPLPTPLAWYANQLPGWFQRASAGSMFFVELVAPFLFFAPRYLRQIGATLTIGLQVMILLTGNYTFFNLLTIALCLWLFVEPECVYDRGAAPNRVLRRAQVPLAGAIGVVSALVMLQTFSVRLPAPLQTVTAVADTFRIVNGYGLFAVMTTERNEIIVEGSNDKEHWRAYEFKYKPGNVDRAPPVIEPFQPRLDWQMWFAALGGYRENRWFSNLMIRLLQGEPAVLRLLRFDPFPGAPPRYIRARLFRYHFTHWGAKAWWAREEIGSYFPEVSLR